MNFESTSLPPLLLLPPLRCCSSSPSLPSSPTSTIIMNAPVVEIQHVGIGRYGGGCLDGSSTTKLDISFSSRDSTELSKKLELIQVDDVKKPTTNNKSVDIVKRTLFNKPTTEEAKSCETASTVSTSSSTKRVCFPLDKKGRVVCINHKNRDIRTKKEIFESWYTPEEFRQFRNDCKNEALRQQKTSYRENFSAVYAACTKGNFKGVTKQRAYVSAASCRGLEVVVFPTLHADRKNTIATVLKTQAALPSTVSGSIREEAIASASRYLSKQARQLARVLGSGDAAVVVANNRIAALQNEKGCVPHCFITC